MLKISPVAMHRRLSLRETVQRTRPKVTEDLETRPVPMTKEAECRRRSRHASKSLKGAITTLRNNTRNSIPSKHLAGIISDGPAGRSDAAVAQARRISRARAGRRSWRRQRKTSARKQPATGRFPGAVPHASQQPRLYCAGAASSGPVVMTAEALQFCPNAKQSEDYLR